MLHGCLSSVHLQSFEQKAATGDLPPATSVSTANYVDLNNVECTHSLIALQWTEPTTIYDQPPTLNIIGSSAFHDRPWHHPRVLQPSCHAKNKSIIAF